MASQLSGFTFENFIRERVFEIPFDPNNTDKYDIPSNKNKFNSNENISIKSSGNGNINCGDIIRFYNYDFNKKNTIIVVSYEQVNDYKIIKNIYEINYDLKMRDYLFGTISEQELLKYVKLIRNIPKGISGKEIRKSFDYLSMKIELQKKHKMKIIISPKIDSRGQRRVQFSIPKFVNTIKNFIVYKSSPYKINLIRDIEIPIRIESKKRIRGGVSKEELIQICRKNKDKIKGYSLKKKIELEKLLKRLNLYHYS